MKVVGADLFEVAAPEIAELENHRKYIKTPANDLGEQTLIKQFITSYKQTKVFPAGSVKPASQSRGYSLKNKNS